jgi:hypothetical protein
MRYNTFKGKVAINGAKLCTFLGSLGCMVINMNAFSIASKTLSRL